MGNKSSRLIFLEANQKLNEYMFEEILNENDGIRRGPFGGALKKDIFVKESDYVVYEQRNAIYDRFDFRYKISFKKYEEMKSFLVKEGDFLLSGAGTIGKISRVPRNASKGIINQALIRIRIDSEKVNPDYFLHWMRSEKMQHRLTSGNPGSAITNLVPLSEVKKWIISIPSIDEQRKIGVFFNLFDNLIALHQQELDALKQTKQGFLQKMFPKDGEIVPEVRFKNFMESWREVSLGTISDSYSGGTPSAGNKQYYNGTIPFIRSAEINSSTTELFLTEKGLNNSSAKLVQKGTILYAMYGATSGEVGISRIDGAINQAILAIKPKEEYDIQFLYQYLKKSKKSIVNSYLQGGQGNLSGAIIKKVSIWLPENREEQIKIGGFFRQLDEVIELKEKEVEALKETKKGFLQKMFI
ncbi:restriction endonuclease subunit S [Exiguobacterium sp. BRG2]|uniref:restriction endonuclease subunit S n=1 Tax=unclassified Exiguobacterium TaxID=2644629 RepID=UPI00288132CA|nr:MULTISPECIES: restriction endonuclease subunit S [unclassified Exiguobacterium]MDT0173054.1 restriction endonuclease subunit S [Exiguobacterium sp. BRG2]